MKREDETPGVGELWQMFDYDGLFWDGYVVRQTAKQWKVLDLADHELVTVSNVKWFWTRVA